MTRAVFHSSAVPPGEPYREWCNTTGAVLLLKLPGLQPLRLRRRGRLQIPLRDLAKAPRLEAWLEGCELAGKLRLVVED